MKKKKYLKIFLLISLIAVVGLSAAYYTDHKAKSNVFTMGRVSISLTEPKYDLPENKKQREDLAPGETFVKDPQITNTGISDAYVFLVADNPYDYRHRVDPVTGKLLDKKDEIGYLGPLFNFEINDGWTKIGEELGNPIYETVYAYGTDKKLKPLKRGETTPTLYKGDKVQYGYFLEDERGNTEEIKVLAVAIQTTDLKKMGLENKDPKDVWEIIRNQITKSEQNPKGGN